METDFIRKEIENLARRLDKNDILTDRIHELAASVQLLAQKVETSHAGLSSVIEKLDCRVSDIEKKPSKRWENAAAQIISLIIACAFGVLVKTGL